MTIGIIVAMSKELRLILPSSTMQPPRHAEALSFTPVTSAHTVL